jgi:hypothetical protein
LLRRCGNEAAIPTPSDSRRVCSRSKHPATKPNRRANANPKLKVIFGVRLPEALHMKLTWLAANTVNNSMHSIALGAVEKEVERLLAEHYKN